MTDISHLPHVDHDERVTQAMNKVVEMKNKVSQIESQIEAHQSTTTSMRDQSDGDYYLQHGVLPDRGVRDQKLEGLLRERSVAYHALNLAKDRHNVIRREVVRELSRSAKNVHDSVAKELIDSIIHAAATMDEYKQMISKLTHLGYSSTIMGEVSFAALDGLGNMHSMLSHKIREWVKSNYLTKQEVKDIGSPAIYPRDDR